jgi:putative phosphoribosyl transferase
MRFKDRFEAGRSLARQLASYANQPNVLVLALPRGGVPVGIEIARALGAPLDVFVVCKLMAPEEPTLAIGAVASGGVRFVNQPAVKELRISELTIQRMAEEAHQELLRQEGVYMGGRAPLGARGRTVIVADDGIATGSTMRAAVLALQQQQPERIVVAVPVAPAHTAEHLRQQVDELVCLNAPDQQFDAVAVWYEAYGAPTEEDVRRMLAQRDAEVKRAGV